MSIGRMRDDEYAERWQRWQRGYAESSRTAAIKSRIVFTLVLIATSAWLVLQIAVSVWN